MAQRSPCYTEPPGKVMSQWALNVMPKPAHIKKKNLNIFIKIVVVGDNDGRCLSRHTLKFKYSQVSFVLSDVIWGFNSISVTCEHSNLACGVCQLCMLRKKMKKKKKTSVLFLHWWIMERALLISMLTIWFWSTNPPFLSLPMKIPLANQSALRKAPYSDSQLQE